MAIISGSDLRNIGVPIDEEISSGSNFSVTLNEGPGYLTLESQRDINGFYTDEPVFSDISGSNLISQIFGRYIISGVLGTSPSGSLTFTAARNIPANNIRIKVASPVPNLIVNTNGDLPPE